MDIISAKEVSVDIVGAYGEEVYDIVEGLNCSQKGKRGGKQECRYGITDNEKSR